MVRTGYYHKNNVLKFRILEAAFHLPLETFTTRDIEAVIGIDFKTIGEALGHYHKLGLGYLKECQRNVLGMVTRIDGRSQKREWKLTKLTYSE